MGNSSGAVRDAPLVVIVGAGYGGMELAQAIEGDFNVLVLEARDAFYHSIGSVRAAVDGDFAPKILVPYTNALKHGFIAKARVMKITADSVQVDGMEELIPFDYLVCATGANYPVKAFRPGNDAFAFDSLLSEVNATRSQVASANDIVVIGAGPVGVELSGEIIRKYPNKKVTVISRSKHVLKSKYFKDALGIEWEKQVAKVTDPEHFRILAEHSVIRDEQKEDGFVVTDKGEKIKADHVFWTVGSSPKIENNDLFMYAGFGDQLDVASQRLKVDGHLRIEGLENVFAIGDVALVDEARTAITAGTHAAHVAKALRAARAGKALPVYKPGPDMMLVPFGEATGAAVLYGKYLGTAGKLATKTIKGKDMLVGKYWGQFNSSLKDANPKYEIGSVSSDTFKSLLGAFNERKAAAAALKSG